jgi:hypothetical protein
LKDEFVGGLKEATGTAVCNQNLKAAGHEQKMLGKEEMAAAKVGTGMGTVGTAAGAHALDKDRAKATKKAEKDQLKGSKDLEKDRIKAEKKAAKERAKLEKGHGDKFEKGHKGFGHKDKFGHKAESIKEEHPVHTEPFVGRVDRLNANHGNPHVEPHIAAMMAHGMPVEGIQPMSQTSTHERPIGEFHSEKPLATSTHERPIGEFHSEKPLASGIQTEQWEKPMASGFRETRLEEVVKPDQKSSMPSTQTFSSQSAGQPIGQPKTTEVLRPSNSGSNQFGTTTFNETTSTFGNKFDSNKLNVSPRGDRLNVSPRKMPISPRHCDAARLETSPRHMAHV